MPVWLSLRSQSVCPKALPSISVAIATHQAWVQLWSVSGTSFHPRDPAPEGSMNTPEWASVVIRPMCLLYGVGRVCPLPLHQNPSPMTQLPACQTTCWVKDQNNRWFHAMCSCRTGHAVWLAVRQAEWMSEKTRCFCTCIWWHLLGLLHHRNMHKCQQFIPLSHVHSKFWISVVPTRNLLHYLTITQDRINDLSCILSST